MIVDGESFVELAVHLKKASDALLDTAKHLSHISNNDHSGQEEEWHDTLGALVALQAEFTYMERLMRALLDANRNPEPVVQ